MIRATVPVVERRTPILTESAWLGILCLLKSGDIPPVYVESETQATVILTPDRAACGLRVSVLLEYGRDWVWK